MVRTVFVVVAMCPDRISENSAALLQTPNIQSVTKLYVRVSQKKRLVAFKNQVHLYFLRDIDFQRRYGAFLRKHRFFIT